MVGGWGGGAVGEGAICECCWGELRGVRGGWLDVGVGETAEGGVLDDADMFALALFWGYFLRFWNYGGIYSFGTSSLRFSGFKGCADRRDYAIGYMFLMLYTLLL